MELFESTLTDAIVDLSSPRNGLLSSRDLTLDCLPIQTTMLRESMPFSLPYRVRLFWEVRSSIGPVDGTAILKAWAELVDRHAALRSLFSSNRDNPIVRIVSQERNAGICSLERSFTTVETIFLHAASHGDNHLYRQ